MKECSSAHGALHVFKGRGLCLRHTVFRGKEEERTTVVGINCGLFKSSQEEGAACLRPRKGNP